MTEPAGIETPALAVVGENPDGCYVPLRDVLADRPPVVLAELVDAQRCARAVSEPPADCRCPYRREKP